MDNIKIFREKRALILILRNVKRNERGIKFQYSSKDRHQLYSYGFSLYPLPRNTSTPSKSIYILILNTPFLSNTVIFFIHLSKISSFSLSPMDSTTSRKSNFNDFLPLMAEKLGGDGLIGELCKGFQLLMDKDKRVITFESLKKNSALLGLQDLNDDDVKSMLKEGDFDGDGALNQMEFCVLMFRLSPELMEQSHFLLEEALDSDFSF
ncbi:calcium-binding protein PBP1-like [Lycium ferocissimum]|uniref:calcium-binding protein PBP1-like n=1 Tax=Lycium ferocissimum TaxID=112874 RepID=UPI0028163894|nr:calcium-binding protein PBP1-like [Lycium ferocissimum]